MIKQNYVSITDDETGISADISPLSISIRGSKSNWNTGYGKDRNSGKVFIFQGSKPETLKLIIDAFTRIHDAQQKLKPKDFFKVGSKDRGTAVGPGPNF